MEITIANPIYDASFKFLMENMEAAKVLISEIIRKKVVSLESQSQESVVIKKDTSKHRSKRQKEEETLQELHERKSVLRLDFLAKIELGNGEQKAAAIELQKYKEATDLIRFREYLGGLYLKQSLRLKGDDSTPLPIYTIYLLGSGYRDISLDHPILYVSPEIRDAVTNERIEDDIAFVKALHHHSCIALLEGLGRRVRDDLERLLSLFEVRTRVYDNPEELLVDESVFPSRFRPVLHCLQEANSSESVRLQMRKERFDRRDEEAVREELEAKKKELKAQEKELKAKDSTIAMQAKELTESKSIIAEQVAELKRMQQELENMKKKK